LALRAAAATIPPLIPTPTPTTATGAGQPDTYRCIRYTVPEDMYVQSFRAGAPNGTHHTVLGVVTDTMPDGESDCAANAIGHQMLFASGVGTTDLTFPDGIAVKLTAGQRIILNLHLYNASDAPLTGTTDIMVKTLPREQVQQEAEAVFAGRMRFTLGKTDAPHPEQTIDGGCVVSRDYTLFALWPHMHKLGTHQRVTHTPAGGEAAVLHDLDYSFDEQRYYLMPQPLAVKTGDRIDVRCTYVNDTNAEVSFGDGSDEEMCFTGLYRYPASGGNIFECSAR
jgi:hypothetical protein